MCKNQSKIGFQEVIWSERLYFIIFLGSSLNQYENSSPRNPLNLASSTTASKASTDSCPSPAVCYNETELGRLAIDTVERPIHRVIAS
jgi:hypothetical protein